MTLPKKVDLPRVTMELRGEDSHFTVHYSAIDGYSQQWDLYHDELVIDSAHATVRLYKADIEKILELMNKMSNT